MAKRRSNRGGGSKPPSEATASLPAEIEGAQPLGPTDSGKTMSELAAKDRGERIARYQQWIRQSLEAQEPFKRAYTKSMQILANDPEGHWSKEALASLGDRPALIINHTTATVMTVCGLQRRTRQIANFLPADPDDAGAVELLSYLYRWIYDQLGMKEIDSEIFMRKYAGGIAFWKFLYDQRDDPRGKPKVKSINPLNVLWDPNYPDCPWDEAMYVIHAEWFTIDDAVDRWPRYEKEIRGKVGNWLKGDTTTDAHMGDTQAQRRFFWDKDTKRVRIAQIYYKRVRTAEVALLADGTVESDPDKVESYHKAETELNRELKAAGMPTDQPVIEFVRMPVTTVYLAHVLDDCELDHDKSPLPFDELGLFPSRGYCFWNRPVGAVEYMTDPQQEKNKRRSVITEIAGRATHSGLLAEEGSVDREKFEAFQAGAQHLVEYTAGSKPPVPLTPPELPQYLVYLEQQATEDIPRTVNVTPELQGQPKANVISGRAINSRQQAGQLSQEMFFDTFATDQGQVAKYLIEMIKDRITIDEARRILGALARNQQDQGAQAVAGTPDDELRKLLSRAFDAKYDVVITTEPWDPTGKIAQTRAVADLFQSVPPPPVPQLMIGFHEMITELAIQAGTLPPSVGMKWLDQLKQAQAALAQPQGAPPAPTPGQAGPPGPLQPPVA